MTGEEIKAFRKRKGLSQEELGALCGVGKSSVSDWEKNNSEPTGGAKKLLEDFMSGRRSIVPLTEQEERLLDENVQKGNFATREDFLAASLVHLLRHGSFDVPTKIAPARPTFEVLDKVAEDEVPYKMNPQTGSAGGK